MIYYKKCNISNIWVLTIRHFGSSYGDKFVPSQFNNVPVKSELYSKFKAHLASRNFSSGRIFIYFVIRLLIATGHALTIWHPAFSSFSPCILQFVMNGQLN